MSKAHYDQQQRAQFTGAVSTTVRFCPVGVERRTIHAISARFAAATKVNLLSSRRVTQLAWPAANRIYIFILSKLPK